MNDLRPVLVAFFMCGLFIGLAILGGVQLFGSDEIKTKTPLRPIRRELVVVDNRVDTLYVYKKP